MSSLTHLNIIGRTTICDLKVDVLSLLKGSSSDMPSTGIHVIIKDDQSELELREAHRKLCEEFPNLLKQELGCLKDFELEIAFKPAATPVFQKPWRVPYALQEDLNAAYEAGIQRGVQVPTFLTSTGLQWCPHVMCLYWGNEKQSYVCAAITRSLSTLN